MNYKYCYKWNPNFTSDIFHINSDVELSVRIIDPQVIKNTFQGILYTCHNLVRLPIGNRVVTVVHSKSTITSRIIGSVGVPRVIAGFVFSYHMPLDVRGEHGLFADRAYGVGLAFNFLACAAPKAPDKP